MSMSIPKEADVEGVSSTVSLPKETDATTCTRFNIPSNKRARQTGDEKTHNTKAVDNN
jgi:hypothetical protein